MKTEAPLSSLENDPVSDSLLHSCSRSHSPRSNSSLRDEETCHLKHSITSGFCEPLSLSFDDLSLRWDHSYDQPNPSSQQQHLQDHTYHYTPREGPVNVSPTTTTAAAAAATEVSHSGGSVNVPPQTTTTAAAAATEDPLQYSQVEEPVVVPSSASATRNLGAWSSMGYSASKRRSSQSSYSYTSDRYIPVREGGGRGGVSSSRSHVARLSFDLLNAVPYTKSRVLAPGTLGPREASIAAMIGELDLNSGENLAGEDLTASDSWPPRSAPLDALVHETWLQDTETFLDQVAHTAPLSTHQSYRRHSLNQYHTNQSLYSNTRGIPETARAAVFDALGLVGSTHARLHRDLNPQTLFDLTSQARRRTSAAISASDDTRDRWGRPTHPPHHNNTDPYSDFPQGSSSSSEALNENSYDLLLKNELFGLNLVQHSGLKSPTAFTTIHSQDNSADLFNTYATCHPDGSFGSFSTLGSQGAVADDPVVDALANGFDIPTPTSDIMLKINSQPLPRRSPPNSASKRASTDRWAFAASCISPAHPSSDRHSGRNIFTYSNNNGTSTETRAGIGKVTRHRRNASESAVFNLLPGGSNSQSILDQINACASPGLIIPSGTSSRRSRRVSRKISRAPYRVLDAPDLEDDYYLNLLDWSSQNVIAVGLSNHVYLWSAATCQATQLCSLRPSSLGGGAVCSVSWSPSGKELAVGTWNGHVQIYDTTTGTKVRTLLGHAARVGCLAWGPPGIVSSGSRDRNIHHHDLRVPESRISVLSGHKQEVCGLKWSWDESLLASGGNDNKLMVWDASTTMGSRPSASASSTPTITPVSEPLFNFGQHEAAVKAIEWSPHQRNLLVSGGGTADRSIRFWNTGNGIMLNAIDTGSQVCNLAWSRNANELVSTHGYSQNQINLWKYPSMTKMATLTGHTYRVLYLAVSPNGENIVTGAGDESLRFWNVFSGPTTCDGTLPPLSALSSSRMQIR